MVVTYTDGSTDGSTYLVHMISACEAFAETVRLFNLQRDLPYLRLHLSDIFWSVFVGTLLSLAYFLIWIEI